MRHEETPGVGNQHRVTFREEFRQLLRDRFAAATSARRAYFVPSTTSVDAWADSMERYRADLRGLLGWPLDDASLADRQTPAVRRELVGEDSDGRIERVWVEALPGWWVYTIVLTPIGVAGVACPVAIVQHGGLGTPELACGFHGPGQYRDVPRRLVRRGCVVVAPQTWRWSEKYEADPAWRETPTPRGEPAGKVPDEIDGMLRATGGSKLALEVFATMRLIDAMPQLDQCDPERIGMAGLSYGGMLTLLATGLDTRIRVGLSSAALNDGSNVGKMADLAWPGGLTRFAGAELAALACPRPLFLELGREDEHIIMANAHGEADRVAGWYDQLGIAERLRVHWHPGAHAFAEDDAGVDFLAGHLVGAA